MKDSYPLPRMEDLINHIKPAKYRSCINLLSGYWQVPLDKQDCEKTAFVTREGLYEYTMLPMGLTNSPATFQHTMYFLLSGLTWLRCLGYIDNVILFR